VELPVAAQTISVSTALRHGEGWGQGPGEGDPCALANVLEQGVGSCARDGEGDKTRRDITTNRCWASTSTSWSDTVAAEGVDLWAGDLSELLSFVSVGGDLLVEVSLDTTC